MHRSIPHGYLHPDRTTAVQCDSIFFLSPKKAHPSVLISICDKWSHQLLHMDMKEFSAVIHTRVSEHCHEITLSEYK